MQKSHRLLFFTALLALFMPTMLLPLTKYTSVTFRAAQAAEEVVCAKEKQKTVYHRFRAKIIYQNQIVAVFEEPTYSIRHHLMAEEMRERAINADREKQKRKLLDLIEEGKSAQEAVLTVFPSLAHTAGEVESAVRIEAKNSRILFDPQARVKFTIVREEEGVTLDKVAFYEEFLLAFLLEKTQMTAKTMPLAPQVSSEQNKQYCHTRARFSTDLSSSSAARRHNVELALAKLNGIALNAGETLSFNDAVGKRTEENGFMTAKVIVDGEYVDGVGGGVCQASTTLYNCALLGGLTVLQVRGHSLKPSYVAASFDAMVNGTDSDLVLRNDTQGPVFLRAEVQNDRALVVLYGCRSEYEIERESVTIKTGSVPADRWVIDVDGKYFSEGEVAEQKRVSYGAASVESEGYLQYFKEGNCVKRVRIRKDVYREKRGIMAKKK